MSHGASLKTIDKDLFKFIGELKEKEQNIIKLRYGLDSGKPMTQKEIGKIFGCSSIRICQYEHSALRKLERKAQKASYRKPTLDDYPDMIKRYISLFTSKIKNEENVPEILYQEGFIKGLNLAKDMFEECIKEEE